MTTLANKKLAVLIDADNAPADIIDRLLEEVAKYGIASVKRIYGDWSHGLSKWKAALLPHAIIPVQQFAYTKGKNATDMALVIDAMDLLYSGNFDGFCIVSSDSDFTRLASRLRESGLTVYGFGEKKTPEAFRKACDKFVYTEIFRPEKQRQEKEKNNGKNHPAAEESAAAPDALPLLKRAVRENADDLGWANLGPIGSYISKINPDFDSRLYGYGKLSDLIKSFDIFEHRTDNNQLQVRRKTESRPERLPESQTEQREARQSQNERNEARTNQNEQRSQNDQPAEGKPGKRKPQSAKAESNAAPKAAKPSFTKLIPAVQQAIQATADPDGWARLGDVVKQLPAAIDPIQYGCANCRDLIHSIYSDWVEIKKAGRGERIRINKAFIVKNEQA